MASQTEHKAQLGLEGVPETMLWPLWNRAKEHARSDALISDPYSARLVERIDYDFAAKFGKPNVFHAIRARVADDLIRRHAAQHGDSAVVVALGEGLETQFWRLSDVNVRWISVDLPEAIAVRRRLLPKNDSLTEVSCSALDEEWFDRVPANSRPFVSAAGLLMYFEEAEVRSLLNRIVTRLRWPEVFFDTIPPLVAKKTLRGWRVSKSYTAPPMPWGIHLDEVPEFLRSTAGLKAEVVQSYGDAYPQRTKLFYRLGKIKLLRRHFAGGLVHATAPSVSGPRQSEGFG